MATDHWGWESRATSAVGEERPAPTGPRYRDGRLIARGGMGRVESVLDAHLGRRVARKTLRAEVATDPAAAERLWREAQVTARLEHPNIVPVYDAGTTADGRLFYTMRLAPGRSLAAAIAEAPDARARLDLLPAVLDAAQAVAYAHSRGVIHRDLKPANILVGQFGETLVADWGVARVLADASGDAWVDAFAGSEGLTVAGAAIGTPGYMPPEQAQGCEIGRSADVFALGKVLHEVLAGRLDAPIDGPPELAAVVARATRTDPTDRYPDASALAKDLEAWLAGRRVAAFAYSTADVARRFVRRWRAPLAVAGLALVGLAALAVGSGVRIARERDRAVAAEDAQRRVTADALVRLGWDRVHADDSAESEALARRALTLVDDAEARGILAAVDHGPAIDAIHAVPLPPCDGAWVLDAAGAHVACAGAESWVAALDPLTAPVPLGRSCEDVVAFPDGAVACRDGDMLTLIGPDGGLRQVPMRVEIRGPMVGVGEGGVAVVSHGKVEWAGGERHGTMGRAAMPDQIRWIPQDVDRYGLVANTGAILHPVEASGATFGKGERLPVVGIEGHEWVDGGDLVGGTLDGAVVRVRSTGALAWRTPVGPGAVGLLRVAPGDARALVSTDRGDVRVIDLRSGAFLGSLPGPVADAAWLDDTRVRVLDQQGVRTWRIPSGRHPVRWVGTKGQSALAVRPDGTRVAVAGGGDDLRLIDLEGGAVVRAPRIPGSVSAMKALAWSPDGARLHGAVVGKVPDVILWDGETLAPTYRHAFQERRMVRDLAVLADGTDLRVHYEGGFRAWSTDEVVDRARTRPVIRRVLTRRWGREALAVDMDGAVYRYDADAAEMRPAWGRDGIGAVAADPGDGPVVAAFGTRLEILDPDNGVTLTSIPMPAPATAVEVDPAGRWVAAGHTDGTVRVWAMADGRLVGVLRIHDARLSALDAGPDGTFLMTTGWDGDVRRIATAPLFAPRTQRAD